MCESAPSACSGVSEERRTLDRERRPHCPRAERSHRRSPERRYKEISPCSGDL